MLRNLEVISFIENFQIFLKNEINNYDFIIPNVDLQKNIKTLVDKVFLELENSKSFYSEAEKILLKELGLENFDAEENLFSIVDLSEVKKNKRMDAEFFTSGWQALEKKKYTRKKIR